MATTTTNEPTRVEVRRAGGLFDGLTGSGGLEGVQKALTSADLETDLRRARQLADWLDTKFELGGVRFGLDALVGLVPVVGDLLGALIGTYPLLIAKRHGLGKRLQARMAWNLLVEWGLGSVPFVGDVFDVAYKANVRNVRLLEQAAEKLRQKQT